MKECEFVGSRVSDARYDRGKLPGAIDVNAARWIPTASLEQYGATLARWFGIAEADLPYVFPSIGAFANSNLGFMG